MLLYKRRTGHRKLIFHGYLFSSSLRFLPQHLQLQTIPHFPLQRPICVLPRPQCHPALEGAVSVVRPLRDIVALMSGILISVQKFYSSKLFVIPALGRPPSWIRYSLFTSLPRVPNSFFFQEGMRKPASGQQLTLNTHM
jgi:hypothetical protein